MSEYMEPRESIGYWYGDDDGRIVETLASRYVGANPPIPFVLRAFSRSGLLQTEEGLYDMNLADRLPHAVDGDYAYVYGLVWSDDERALEGNIEPLSPVKLYVNEEQLYRSDAVAELKLGARIGIPLLFRKGWNTVLIEARKTAAGFGCFFGAEEGKVRIMQVLAPFADRAGGAGWVWSEPVKGPIFGNGVVGGIANGFPVFKQAEAESGLRWLPEIRWTKEREAKPNCERVFGRAIEKTAAYGWTALDVPGDTGELELKGHSFGPMQIWFDGVLKVSLEEEGPFTLAVPVEAGIRKLFVKSVSGPQSWGFDFRAYALPRLGTQKIGIGEALPFIAPVPVHGHAGAWLYAGPCDPMMAVDPAVFCTTTDLYDVVDLQGRPAGKSYWTLDAPHTRVRPYYENAMLSSKWTTGSATNYGRWDYPLGVTMYGLLRASRELNRQDLADYALGHIRSCTDMYDYSLWDKEQYGFPSINHQLVLIRMLDNCGSFGSAMLEAYQHSKDEKFLRIADTIADFILRKLERRADGAFYRLCVGEYSADTMWADDLYMSGPFLTRYALVTGKQEALDEAATQFLLYRGYLFMEEEGIMSHVFDFKYGKPTRVPWGRGNGWSLFSLSELLERLPEKHAKRGALLALFRDMSEGVAALQGESGLWRQVLNNKDAYEEASCTAMFAYAFARGVRFGWLDRENGDVYAAAARKAWRALTSRAIDRQGNVHGVCSGSRYSYSPDYYMYDLRTVVNDNHGIGIMMLAGVEICRMTERASVVHA